MKSKIITKETLMSEVLDAKIEAAEILFEAGMGCVGCPMSQMESLEAGCKAHGMKNKDIEKLIEKLNNVKDE